MLWCTSGIKEALYMENAPSIILFWYLFIGGFLIERINLSVKILFP